MDLIDAADLQLEALAFWSEEAGVSTRNVGLAWRRPDGTIRGVLSDDSRPADTIAKRLREAMSQPGWVEPDGMSDHLSRLLAKHSQRWNTLTDLLYEAAA
ncbi:hypothetical protein A6F55_13340 [Prescottella equi]|uniref:hypothetical protein n=1 Tax=Rhodococcus hoagii TaxID=43767 RepID=UPI000A1053D1|nr:hypothetical protein [Prescottella equi]ORL03098.1 hypothetical protein A6F55_13340 [Prescottella equi]